MSSSKLVLLGVGKAARHVNRSARENHSSNSRCDHYYELVYGSTRSVERLCELEENEISPLLLQIDSFGELSGTDEIAEIVEGADVLVSFPPDASTDATFSALCQHARRIVYLSSTSVYGKLSGVIDESSPVDISSPTAVARLIAEENWRQKGAIVLRVAGMYDKTSGLHNRLRSGSYNIPGDGTNYVSRIHLEDLASIVLAAFRRGLPASTYVVADSKPATHLEVASWLCDKMMMPIPSMVPLESVHETLRGNRQILAQQVLQDLGVDLKYPTFEEGYSGALEAFLHEHSQASATGVPV
ncbi:MAG TPA: NAD-dependent epimerase/dehydratase family protein [Oculatellaceae cyanobacterium]